MGPIWQRLSTSLLRHSALRRLAPPVHPSRLISTSFPPNPSQGNNKHHPFGPQNEKEKESISSWPYHFFCRLKQGGSDDALAGELLTSVVTYRKKLPWLFSDPFLKVDLVSMIHLADKRYYAILQERLQKDYDCVLYEEVKLKNHVDVPELLEGIDPRDKLLEVILSLYRQQNYFCRERPNWKNADLDFETIERLKEEAIRSLQNLNLTAQSESEDEKDAVIYDHYIIYMPYPLMLLNFVTDKEYRVWARDILDSIYECGSVKLWLALAKREFEEIRSQRTPLQLAEYSVLIIERNKFVIEELKKAINRGERSIAIVYGAGHMPDFHARLYNEFNLVPTNVDWVTAWSIERIKFKIIRQLSEKCFGKETAMALFWGTTTFFVLVLYSLLILANFLENVFAKCMPFIKSLGRFMPYILGALVGALWAYM